jgi:hypothetical protein
VQFVGCSNPGYANPVITLISAAFSGCNLTPVSSTFPGQGQDPPIGSRDYNNTVTGSLQGSTLSLTAEWLTYFFPDFPNDMPSLNASWGLEGCPSVRQLASYVEQLRYCHYVMQYSIATASVAAAADTSNSSSSS